jgi:hypothetical protein
VKLKLTLLAVCVLLIAPSFAQHWDIEQVDSASVGGYVAIDRMSDGAVWLAYVDSDSGIRLAHRDSAWLFEDLDTAMIRPMLPAAPIPFDALPFSFDIGPNDVIGVVGLGRLAERRGSGWSSEDLPMPMRDLSLSYDPACQPSLTFKDSLWQGCLGVKADSGWDTNVVFLPSEYTWFYTLSRPAWRQNDNCAFMWAEVWSDHIAIDGYGVGFFRRDGGTWSDITILSGLDGGSSGFVALVGSSDSIHTFWSASDPYGIDELVCDHVHLDGSTDIGTACLDVACRVQCAWFRDGLLKFAVPGRGTWTVPDAGSLVWCDITTDTLSQPVLAICREDGSIWLAHGVDVVGQDEEPGEPTAHGLQFTASIVSNVLFVPANGEGRMASGELLDATGHAVLALKSGTNDVSRLAPGVYFVVFPHPNPLPQGARERNERSAVRKMVIAR